MNITNLRFKIDELGCLLVSIDKGCTWENLGKVVGDGSLVPGPQVLLLLTKIQSIGL